MITREKIQEIADKVAREFQPEKIILFGSFAWETLTEDSDESNNTSWVIAGLV